MSYPDKEKHTDYQLDNVETLKQKLNNQHDIFSKDEKLEDTMPVGQLKWRKGEEFEEDTHHNLGLAKKKSSVVKNSNKEKKPETGKDEEVQDGNEGSGKKEKPGSENAEIPFAPENESSNTGRQLSLEDTLTPINFKEYSIDPALDQKNSGESMTEEEKPSFVAKPDLMASDAAAQRKKQNTFAGGKAWEKEEEKQIPKWVRIYWLPATLIFVLFAGLIIGHSVIGEQPVSDIFDIDMWIHIFKLMYG
ncbi:DNA-directed RNA polymerase subunit beta [Thermoactinomyces mirandus]|uniref:DNA-directed RNA polymerase subunit beta n=1 Tax=Thermoactinomyces mirandus TaxID=2756294 RepID=A0A7W1XTH6_9BACL|nr:DNA-directed RNA polymerase subunit beta [Thermoactinomyces mirandus]MBA4602982.1 DNA-directed RNA polymerase subunit beta [Thermoactinomyces mirandus]